MTDSFTSNRPAPIQATIALREHLCEAPYEAPLQTLARASCARSHARVLLAIEQQRRPLSPARSPRPPPRAPRPKSLGSDRSHLRAAPASLDVTAAHLPTRLIPLL
eukprot:6178163-Pleurochrysis_carterae.AAC.1